MTSRVAKIKPYWFDYYPSWLSTYYRCTDNDKNSVAHMCRALPNILASLQPLWADETLRVIDLGVGNGIMAENVCRELRCLNFKDVQFYGVDVQTEAVAAARQRLGAGATIVHGDIFREPMESLLPQALPAHLVMLCHVAYFVHNPWRKWPRYAKFAMLWGLSRMVRNTLRPCFGRDTIGCMLHLYPVSYGLALMLWLHGFEVHTVSRNVFKIRCPKLDSSQWDAIEQGRISSIEEVCQDIKPAQDMQHLIEISCQIPLAILSSRLRNSFVKYWRNLCEQNDYNIKRTEVLDMVVRRDADPRILAAVRQLDIKNTNIGR